QATGTGKAACTGTGKSIYKDSCEGRDEFTGWQASRASACKIKLICQRENLGFAEASNTGAQNSTGRYLLFLNPDTELVQRGLEKMVDFLDERNRQTKVGITGAKLLNSDGTLQFSCRAFPTLARQMYESFFLHRVFPGSRVFGSYFLTWWDHAHERQVDWLSGAFMLCSREVFLNAGGFDRDYFMYCEDTDICLKLSRKGYTNYYYPDYMLIHADAGIASKDNALRNCQIWQSRELYFRKNYGYAHAKAFSLLYFLFSLNRVLLFYTLSFFKPGDKALRPRARQYMQSICMYFKKKYK
ncbi:MAG: glycosyltransferase, partial [Actinobacteria bacterium]|nr:glycosyltransferase [Actinomycetota bacterium]